MVCGGGPSNPLRSRRCHLPHSTALSSTAGCGWAAAGGAADAVHGWGEDGRLGGPQPGVERPAMSQLPADGFSVGDGLTVQMGGSSRSPSSRGEGGGWLAMKHIASGHGPCFLHTAIGPVGLPASQPSSLPSGVVCRAPVPPLRWQMTVWPRRSRKLASSRCGRRYGCPGTCMGR